jgi:hypothetical protein
MTTSLAEKAVAGRRVKYLIHRSAHDDRTADAYQGGIVTGTVTAGNGRLLAKVRLDGDRSSLTLPADYDGLRYLDEVVPVPVLPMGRFTPVEDEMNGFFHVQGVLVTTVGEDGDEWVFITDDRDKAKAAALAYAEETDVDVDFVDFGALEPKWAAFEWEPEESESPWVVHWDAQESDDHAVHVFYLIAA